MGKARSGDVTRYNPAPFINLCLGYIAKPGTVKELTLLSKDSWRLYHNFKKKGIVARRCDFPILFFGDIQAYFGSALRIVTVGKNPSEREYYGSRFPPKMNSTNVRSYLDGLNGYFECNPYDWFANYECVLNGMNTSYYVSEGLDVHRNRPNVALHTDLCSPLATAESWGRLAVSRKPKVRKAMAEMRTQGVQLWRRLIQCLKPDIIIMSFRKDYVEEEIAPLSKWSKYAVRGEKKQHLIRSYMLPLGGKDYVVVFLGPSRQTPFGGISAQDRKKIGMRFSHIYSKTGRQRNSRSASYSQLSIECRYGRA